MKKFSKFAAMFLIGTFALCTTSCSSDEYGDDEIPTVGSADTNINSSDLVMQKIAKTYIKDVVNPTYTDLANYTQTLYEACTALYAAANAGTMTQEHIDAACEAFKDARREWERSEAFLYGAASDNNIDPHIDSWPLDRDQLESALNNSTLIAGFKGDDPARFVYNNNSNFDSVLGFHGMEFVLFRNGANRTVAALSGNDTDEGVTSVKGIDELAFLAAVAGDLRNMCYLLEYGWLGDTANTHKIFLYNNCKYVLDDTRYQGLSPRSICYGDYLLKATTSTGYFTTWAATLANIFIGGCSNICNEVYNQKLGQAYRVAIGAPEVSEEGEEDSSDYIESPYSKRSFIDYQDNIYSIKNTLYGTRDIAATAPVENSLMTYLKQNGYQNATSLDNALNDAIQALETAKNSGKAFIDAPGDPQVKNCIDKIQALDDALVAAGNWIATQTDK